MTETPAGMLSATGLPNPGVDAVVERYAATWAALARAGHRQRRRRVGRGYVGAWSAASTACPGWPASSSTWLLQRGRAAAAAVDPHRPRRRRHGAVRRATDLPLLVKLTPDVADMRAIARAIEAAGADAICAIGPPLGLAIDRERRRPLLGDTTGACRGPAIKPVGLRVVYEVAQAVRIPIVAIGGVAGLDDVLDFLMAGASAVQVGTAIFADPTLPLRLVDELAAWCAAHGMGSFRELIGVALPSGPRGRDRTGVGGVDRPS